MFRGVASPDTEFRRDKKFLNSQVLCSPFPAD
jgi:hypothetical protein